MKNKTKNNARVFPFLLVLMLLLTLMPAGAFADTKDFAYLKPDVTVTMNGQALQFFDENGQRVYPVIFHGSTFLPVRAVSGLMGQNIEWVSKAQTIYIGRTVSNPGKSLVKKEHSPYVAVTSEAAVGEQQVIPVYVKDKLFIMYDFEPLIFKDANGSIVNPIIYNGTTYLPIRSVAELMGQNIAWNSVLKTVQIASQEEASADPIAQRQQTAQLLKIYEQITDLYNSTTAKITTIRTNDLEQQKVLASSFAADLEENATASKLLTELLTDSSCSNAELQAAQKMKDFCDINNQYLSLMQAMSYTACQGGDYSVYAEYFLNYAILTEDGIQEAEDVCRALRGE